MQKLFVSLDPEKGELSIRLAVLNMDENSEFCIDKVQI